VGSLPPSKPPPARRAGLRCGVAVVDVRTGAVVAAVDFRSAVEEIFDVQLLAGPHFPEVLGFQHETLQHTFVVPPGGD
jgi:hypothetical protein